MTTAPSFCVPAINWHWSNFSALSSHDLYAILALRQDVFVLEQQSLFRDIDGIDLQSDHLLGWHGSGTHRTLVAYLRCVPPGVLGPQVRLQRVLCARSTRGSGLGRQLFATGVAYGRLHYPTHPIAIAAQMYLEKFYADFGFEGCSEPYLEDGIWHRDMRCAPEAKRG